MAHKEMIRYKKAPSPDKRNEPFRIPLKEKKVLHVNAARHSFKLGINQSVPRILRLK